MKTLFTLLIQVSLLLAGCTAGETPGVEPVKPPVTATVPLIVESATVNAEVTTRAATTLTSGSIGVFRLAGNGYTAVNNSRYDYAPLAWTPGGGPANAVLLGGEVARVCAYHPWQASLNSTAIPLTSQVLTDANNDISFATSRAVDGSSINKTTTFNMIRAYAKVTFKFKRDNYSGTCQVQKVELKNLLPSATLDIGTGAYSTAAGVANSSVSQEKSVTVPATDTVPWGSDILLVPCTPAGTGMTIVITVDGKTMTTTIPVADYQPERGEYATITIMVQGTGINITKVETEDWVNGELGPYETALAIGIQVPSDEINLGGTACTDQDKTDLSSLIWAPGNLRQTNDDGTGPVIMCSATTDYGHYYTWNSEYTGNTTSNGIDPCTKLDPAVYGTGWRTPTKNEVEKLSRCTDKQLVSNNGVMGMWFMNNPHGVFLPASGHRDNNVGSGTSPTYRPGNICFYWSSNAGNGNGGYCLYLKAGNPNVNNYIAASGFCVRCVKGNQQ